VISFILITDSSFSDATTNAGFVTLNEMGIWCMNGGLVRTGKEVSLLI
jgi:hypothetical protein